MSSKMGAMVGYVLGEKFTNPSLGSISVTSDGFIIAYPVDEDGNMGHSEFLGSVADFRRNLGNLIAVAGLTKSEFDEFQKLYNKRVESWEWASGRFHV